VRSQEKKEKSRARPLLKKRERSTFCRLWVRATKQQRREEIKPTTGKNRSRPVAAGGEEWKLLEKGSGALYRPRLFCAPPDNEGLNPSNSTRPVSEGLGEVDRRSEGAGRHVVRKGKRDKPTPVALRKVEAKVAEKRWGTRGLCNTVSACENANRPIGKSAKNLLENLRPQYRRETGIRWDTPGPEIASKEGERIPRDLLRPKERPRTRKRLKPSRARQGIRKRGQGVRVEEAPHFKLAKENVEIEQRSRSDGSPSKRIVGYRGIKKLKTIEGRATGARQGQSARPNTG